MTRQETRGAEQSEPPDADQVAGPEAEPTEPTDSSQAASGDLGLGTEPPQGSGPADAVLAAGALPWRRRRGELQVALVHRPRYDDWAWAKGKLEPNEGFPAAAVREVAEETGLRIRLGVPLPTAHYRVPRPGDAQGSGEPKVVAYWAGHVLHGDGALAHEVDKIVWLNPAAASAALSYPRDSAQLDALVAADRQGHLGTWPLLLVRHAKATPRRHWSGPDWLRPLDERGFRQSADLVGLLQAYGVQRLRSSSATRCVQTLEPFAHVSGVRLRTTQWLSEEGFEQHPRRAADYLTDALRRGEPVAVCTHGPLVPGLLEQLASRISTRRRDRHASALPLQPRQLLTPPMAKGEVVVAHVRGRGSRAAIVAVERHLPLR